MWIPVSISAICIDTPDSDHCVTTFQKKKRKRGTAESHTPKQQNPVVTGPQVHGTKSTTVLHPDTQRMSKHAHRVRWAHESRLLLTSKATDPHAPAGRGRGGQLFPTAAPIAKALSGHRSLDTGPKCRASSGVPRPTSATPEALLSARTKPRIPGHPAARGGRQGHVRAEVQNIVPPQAPPPLPSPCTHSLPEEKVAACSHTCTEHRNNSVQSGRWAPRPHLGRTDRPSCRVRWTPAPRPRRYTCSIRPYTRSIWPYMQGIGSYCKAMAPCG